MEASALQAPARLTRISLSGPLLRLRSDEQLVALFRAGSDDAFRVIHDRYRQRLLAYMRQMLSGSRPDAEDALQDVFLRAHAALRADERPISLRAWLYRVAHNRCIDHIRRPQAVPTELADLSEGTAADPLVEAERREDLRRLVADVRRLPAPQRSVLLMREMEGLTYAELAGAMNTTIPAIKSLLVRARMGLVEAAEARDTACLAIREDLTLAHGRGVRATGLARRHLRDCAGCRDYRDQMRTLERKVAAIVPATVGPLGLFAQLFGGGAAAGGAGGGTLLGGGAAAVTATKVAAVVCAAVVTAGGAIEVGRKLDGPTGERKARPAARQQQPGADTRPATAAQWERKATAVQRGEVTSGVAGAPSVEAAVEETTGPEDLAPVAGQDESTFSTEITRDPVRRPALTPAPTSSGHSATNQASDPPSSGKQEPKPGTPSSTSVTDAVAGATAGAAGGAPGAAAAGSTATDPPAAR